MPKGDPITLAEVSAVLGVKKQANLFLYVTHFLLTIQLPK